MGGGASSQGSFEQMLACTMILGEAMVQGLDPRFVRFPDMYRLFDFHVGPKRPLPTAFPGGSMVILVHSPDDSGKFQQISTGGKPDKAGGGAPDDDDDELPAESTAALLVVYIGKDKVVLDKATLNQPNGDNWTPLHACSHTINTQDAGIAILNELVAQKADLDIATRRGPGAFSCGWTPLHIACAYGLEALALKLIRAGADVNVMNSVKWTPLYEACHRGYSSIVRELLKAGARPDVICPEFALCPFPGQCALAEAARQGHEATVKVLLDWGVDKNAVNKLGWTALHEAAYHSRLSIVKLLVVYGADVFVKTPKGSLAKDVTIHGEIRAMLEDLCQHGPASSPKREQQPPASADTGSEAKPIPKKSSPTKAQSTRASVPLSRKEEYALLGDLPSLDGKAVPAILIQDGGDSTDQDDGDSDDGAKRSADDDTDAKAEQTDGHSKPQQSNSSSISSKKKKHKKKPGLPPAAAPQEFKCAVSRKVLKDPLRSPYGQVFERQVIEAWFRDFGNRCPLTGEPLTPQQLVRDEGLKARIREWKHGSRLKAETEATAPASLEHKEQPPEAKPASLSA
ncbi:hypothetical protein PybrP1_001786 [[Pythium] brassicae (nom. inval.)]|nr:hypothetical protein PybrP1_001786 [[Pythium] brassicae (nom. inval.)]